MNFRKYFKKLATAVAVLALLFGAVAVVAPQAAMAGGTSPGWNCTSNSYCYQYPSGTQGITSYYAGMIASTSDPARNTWSGQVIFYDNGAYNAPYVPANLVCAIGYEPIGSNAGFTGYSAIFAGNYCSLNTTLTNAHAYTWSFGAYALNSSGQVIPGSVLIATINLP